MIRKIVNAIHSRSKSYKEYSYRCVCTNGIQTDAYDYLIAEIEWRIWYRRLAKMQERGKASYREKNIGLWLWELESKMNV